MAKKVSIATVAVAFCIISVLYVGSKIKESSNADHSSVLTVSNQADSLEEEMYWVDLIVKGHITEYIKSGEQHIGVDVPDPAMDVTAANFKVNKVVHGNLNQHNITLFQHGDYFKEDQKQFIKRGEEVYLLLSKRPDGKGYWSYNFDDGIWYIHEGKVYSKSKLKKYQPLKNKSVKEFERRIKKAAENKQKPKSLM